MSERAFDITFLISFFVILIFALSLDVMDFIWELIGFPMRHSRSVTLVATKSISAALDGVTSIIIGGWVYWSQKKRPAGKKEAETPAGEKAQSTTTPTAESTAATPEESEGQKTRPTGAFVAPPRGVKPKATGGIGGKKALLSTLRISGLGLVGEVFPIIGMAPFWTLTVIKTFLNVIKER